MICIDSLGRLFFAACLGEGERGGGAGLCMYVCIPTTYLTPLVSLRKHMAFSKSASHGAVCAPTQLV
jgi:hypothetical protein